MSPNKWGPPTWTLLHTLAEKITETGYQRIGMQLFGQIYRICNSLPCPDCADHATRFLAKVNVSALKTKTDLKNILYVFHNVVNVRKRKPTFHTDSLEIYKRKNLNFVYNNFVQVYNTRGNMKLLTESFQRQRVLSEFKRWLSNNFHFFVETPVFVQPSILPPAPPSQPSSNEDSSDINSNELINQEV